MRRRLDLELVRRGLAPSRTEAQRLIAAGRVTVSGAPATNAARQVDPGEPVEIIGPPPRFVSRGGEKLDAALDAFGIDVAGARVLDAGASTGGFSDCVLQRGAAWVGAIDVGHGQLHPKIRNDERVLVREHTNVRSLTSGDLGGVVDVVVADLSFISLRVVLPALLECVRPSGDLVLLVKPQFEAGRKEVAKGRGVITDPEIWDRVRTEVGEALVAEGAEVLAWITSPITGSDGNVEFLVHAHRASGAANTPGDGEALS